jgi:hypothetical protein
MGDVNICKSFNILLIDINIGKSWNIYVYQLRIVFFCSGYLRLAMFVAVKVGRAGKIIELLLLEELPEG